MSRYVLTRPENAKSAVKLGLPVVMEASEIPTDSDVIRWGTASEPDKRGWRTVLNKRQTLELSINKVAALEALSAVVKIPKLYHQGDHMPAGSRYVMRPATHAEGSDFQVVGGGPCTADHATKLIEGCKEYRVWFVRGNYLVAKRIPRPSEGQTAGDLCRSKWGYSFAAMCFPKLAVEMGKARQAIPLDFGAVDVLWKDGSDGEPGTYYFLEFNSAPSLDHDRVLEFFKRELFAILPRQDAPNSRQEAVSRVQTAPEVPRAVPAPVRAANGNVASSSWEDRYRAKLLAEKKAREEAIYNEVYGS